MPGPRAGTKTAECAEYIRERLADGVAVDSKVIRAELEEQGFCDNTIKNAKKHAGAVSEA